jgi:hypothetical protein
MQEKKRQEKQKDGVDFLIKQGYKKLSAKTFISDVDLERFLNKDFQNINKTRALGFIQILEREYDVDLDELKEAYLDHESAHKPKEPDKLFVEKPIKDDKAWQKYIPYVIGALVFVGLAYYLFRPTVESENLEPLAKQLEENKSIIEKAEKNLAKLDQNDNRSESTNILQESLKKENTAPTASKEEDDLDLDKVVLQMMKERNISTTELNISLPQEANGSVESAKKDTNKMEKIKTIVKKDDNISVVKSKPVVKTERKKKKATKSTFYVEPLQKAWVGVIYLDNFKKKDFLIRSKLPLDPSRDQLIVVGHRFFKIYNKDYSVKFTGRGPVRFIYRDGELMEINKKEFIKTSEGVGW